MSQNNFLGLIPLVYSFCIGLLAGFTGMVFADLTPPNSYDFYWIVGLGGLSIYLLVYYSVHNLGLYIQKAADKNVRTLQSLENAVKENGSLIKKTLCPPK